jgi:UDP-N-acetylmuramate--alanine ligase
MDIYPARELPIDGITSGLIYNEIQNLNKDVSLIHDKNKIIELLLTDAKKSDTIVFQGAGDITNLCSEFVKILDPEIIDINIRNTTGI